MNKNLKKKSFINCLEYTMVKHFGSLTWRLFGHPAPDSISTLGSFMTGVVFSSPLIWLLLVRCSSLTCDGCEDGQTWLVHKPNTQKRYRKEMQRVENLHRESRSPLLAAANRKSNKYKVGCSAQSSRANVLYSYGAHDWLVPVFVCVFQWDLSLLYF